LERRMQEPVITDHFCRFTASQIDSDTHTVFIRLVTNFSNTFDFFVAYQLSNTLNQFGFIGLIRHFSKDNALTVTVDARIAHRLNDIATAYMQAAFTRAISV